MKTISIKMNEKDILKIEELVLQKKWDRRTIIRTILESGIKQVQLDVAINNVRDGKWTVGKGAEFCNKSYRSFLKILRTENISFPISKEELERELY